MMGRGLRMKRPQCGSVLQTGLLVWHEIAQRKKSLKTTCGQSFFFFFFFFSSEAGQLVGDRFYSRI